MYVYVYLQTQMYIYLWLHLASTHWRDLLSRVDEGSRHVEDTQVVTNGRQPLGPEGDLQLTTDIQKEINSATM